jgi:hypothetical protein
VHTPFSLVLNAFLALFNGGRRSSRSLHRPQ